MRQLPRHGAARELRLLERGSSGKGRMVYEAPLPRFQAERDEVKARFLTL